MERLQKIIAASGLVSRRAAEELIVQGRVSVNKKVIKELGVQVDSDALITVDSRPLPSVKRVTYMLNKPKGYICSRLKQANEKLVTELVPPYPPVYPIGRLDKDTEGLLLLTNDGSLAERLTHPKYEKSKTYIVYGTAEEGSVPERLRDKLLKGVKLGDGKAAADSVKISDLPNNGGMRLVITVHEGRHHLIRRLCAAVGVEVRSLRRLTFDKLELGRLPIGAYRTLTERDITPLL